MIETNIIGPEDERSSPSSDDDEKPNGIVQLGEYVIEGRIGAGGMGQVFKARQPSLDRMIALKVLPRSVAGNRDAVERFYREAKSAARLVHPNIVQIYTVGEERGTPYFAMEYIVGEDLDRRMRRGARFTVEESVGIAASVAMALACAGEQGIVHRDIKPANIMIDAHGVVKVTDFGLAKAVKALDQGITQAGFIVGTPTYMAPEQAEGREVDVRTDIYSLGAVFYELLCGKPPFAAEDPASLIYMHVHKAPDPPRKFCDSIPEEVERICVKCLAKKPEDRYENAQELLKDLLHVKEEVSRSGEDGTIIFDKNMASLLIAAPIRKDAKDSRRPAKKTDRTLAPLAVSDGAMAWMSSHWPILAGAAAVALSALVVLLVLLLVGDSPAADGKAEGAAAVSTEQGGAGAPRPGGPVVELSKLRGALPEEAEVEMQIGDRAPYRVRSLDDQSVEPGPVKVIVRRPHYREAAVDFVVNDAGCVPALTPELFRFEPDAGITLMIERARDGIASGDFLVARQALNVIRLADPHAAVLEEMDVACSEAKLAWDSRWTAEFEKARALIEASKYDEADLLLAKIPLQHQVYQDADKLRTKISDLKGKIREGRVRIEAMIRDGKFIEARASYDTLVTDHRVPAEQLADLLDRVEDAERLEKQAAEAAQAGNHEASRALLRKLQEVAATSSALGERIARLDEVIQRGGQAAKIVAAIEENIADLAFDAARDGLNDLRKVDANNTSIDEIDARIKRLSTRHEMERVLGFLDKSFTALDAETASALVDSGSTQLSQSCASALAAFSAGGVRFVRSKHKLGEFALLQDGSVSDVKWEYTLDVEPAMRRVSGSQDLRFSFRRRPEGLRVWSVTEASKPTVALDGAGVTKDERIQGRITAIDGIVVTLDRGAAHGVKLRMIFTAYRDGRVIKMPLVDTVVAVEEEKIGPVRVIEVRRDDCLASFLGDAQARQALKLGALVVQAPLLSVPGSVPALVAARASRPSCAMGDSLSIDLDVRNIDGISSYYEWRCSGGRLDPNRTTVPRTTWHAPAIAGDYTVGVSIRTPLGESTREITVKSLGVDPSAAGLRAGATLNIGAAFGGAGDICFDETNAAYALDARTGRLHVMSSEFEPRSVSSPYRGRALRVRSDREHVYVLDSAGVVRSFALGRDPFAAPPGTTYGGAGIGNGKLRRPTAFALTPAGDVAVIDAGTWTLQVFGKDGRFLASFGTQGKGVGNFTHPVAIESDSSGCLYVLDSVRQQVLAFRNGGFDVEFAVGSADGEIVDMAYDAIGDRLLVLDVKRRAVLAYSTGGRALGEAVAANAAVAADAKGDAPATPGRLEAPVRIVCDGCARFYVLDGERTQVVRRYALTAAQVPAVFTGELETTVPLTFSKICTGSDAMIHLLDASGGSVWRMSPDGWRVVELGGTASKSHWSSATAVACDGAGGFYVLDSALSTVHRYNPAGERVGRFGKKAGRDDPHGIPGAISMAGSPVNASVAGRAIAGTQDGYVAVLLRDRPFGVHLFSPDGVPRSPFPAKADNQRPCSRVAVRSEGTVYLVPQTGGYIEEFNRDGGLVRRREIPATDASGLALSPGGTLYVLDMRKRVIVIVPQDGAVGKVNIPRSVRSPTDIACDGYGTVGLLDGRARTISLYHPAPRGAAGAE